MKRKTAISLFVGFVLVCAGTLHAQQQTTNLNEAILLMGRTLNNRIPNRPKTAVLSFTTGFPDLSDYVTGETTTALGKNPLLTVTPLGNMKQTLQNGGFKLDTELSISTAQDWGRRLQGNALVFGSIQPSGGSYRLTVTAIEVTSGQVYWTNTYLFPPDALLNSLTKSTPTPDDQQAAAKVEADRQAAAKAEADRIIATTSNKITVVENNPAKKAYRNFSSIGETYPILERVARNLQYSDIPALYESFNRWEPLPAGWYYEYDGKKFYSQQALFDYKIQLAKSWGSKNDQNGDGRINCSDYAELFYNYALSEGYHVRYIINERLNHAFNAVNINGSWITIEPQAAESGLDRGPRMSDIWPNYNPGYDTIKKEN